MALPTVRGFPLPDAYFPPLNLTPEQVQGYEQQAQAIVKNALVEYNLHEAMTPVASYASGGWHSVATVDDLTALEASDRASYVWRIFGRVSGDYRNFIDFFYAETSQQLFEWNQIMYGHAVDAAVLRNIHTARSGRPHVYMGVKWTCLQPSSFSRKRDNVFLEYMVFTKDLRGRDVGVRVNLPLEIPECPPLPAELKVARIKTHIVSIVRPADGDSSATQLFTTCHNDYAGYRVPRAYLKKVMATLANMTLLADARRLSMATMADPKQWTDKSSCKTCGLCSRMFNATRRRRHCRMCGDVFCANCTVERGAPVRDGVVGRQRTDFTVVKTKFCKLCVANSRFSDLTRLAVCSSEVLADTSSSSSVSGGGAERKRAESHSTTEDEGDEDEDEDEDDDERFSIGLDAEDYSECQTTHGRRPPALSTGSTLDTIDDQDEWQEDEDDVFLSRGSLDIAEEIDTKDMMSMSRVKEAVASRQAAESLSQSMTRLSSQPTAAPSPQAISALIAEQEDLLRKMMAASQSGSGSRQPVV